MEAQLEQIREQQKETWNKFSGGWKKWDGLVMEFLKPMGAEMIRLLKPANDDVILDVAAGTGEPGLTIAAMLNGGKVISIDLAEDMLKVADENAAKRGIKNFETKVADVCELPFADNSFDAISCRFGFMFFPDMLMAAKEMARVLKPGGRIAVSVWNVPEKNFWVTGIMGILNKNIEMSPPQPGAPGMFRCAADGLIAGLFKEAGLKNISLNEITTTLNSETNETYWNMQNEVAAPVVGALSKADDAVKAKIKAELFELLDKKFAGAKVNLPASALVIYAEK
ncbi:MAG: methyltransferase domain-containing protein [Ferruginibacter sp.]